MPKAKEQSVNSLLAKGKVHAAVELAMELALDTARMTMVDPLYKCSVAKFRKRIRPAIYLLKRLDRDASDEG